MPIAPLLPPAPPLAHNLPVERHLSPAPAPAQSMRITTLCVLRLCLGYRTPLTSEEAAAPEQPDPLSALIIVSATFLLICLIAVGALVIVETLRASPPYADLLAHTASHACPHAEMAPHVIALYDALQEISPLTTAAAAAKLTARRASPPPSAMQPDASVASATAALSTTPASPTTHSLATTRDDADAPSSRDCVCAVCLDEISPQCVARTLPCCHSFHAACIDRWLFQLVVSNPTESVRSCARCPVCNSHFLLSRKAAAGTDGVAGTDAATGTDAAVGTDATVCRSAPPHQSEQPHLELDVAAADV